MNKNKQKQHISSTTESSYGFFSKSATAVLLIFFFLQPFSQIYAEEIVSSGVAVLEISDGEIVADGVDPLDAFPVPVSEVIEEDVSATEAESDTTHISTGSDDSDDNTSLIDEMYVETHASTTSTTFEINSIETTPEVLIIDDLEASSSLDHIFYEDNDANTDLIVTPDEIEAETASTTLGIDDSASTTNEGVDAGPIEASTTTLTTEEIINEIVEVNDEVQNELNDETVTDESLATTTPEVEENNTELINIVNNAENRYQFSESECLSVSDGTFYCSKEKGHSENQRKEFVAIVDDEGDKEIFVTENGKSTQLTFNQYDDSAPYYDNVSNRVVWHSLQDGRFQIMSLDLETKIVTQLTNEMYNSMQPAAYGEVTVWQAWVNGSWEVILNDSSTTTALTDNNYHDVTPRINGEYVVWQAAVNESWQVQIYNLKTRRLEIIHDDSGALVENPRFVLVYDTKYENGDVETKGYDLERNTVVPLSSTPPPLPRNLPTPTPTEEETALVQIQVSPKQETEFIDEDEGEDSMEDGEVLEDIVAEDGDVVVPPFFEATASTSATSTIGAEIEIIEEHTTTTTPPQLLEIQDVVVPPMEELTHTDSQAPIATSTTISDNRN